MREVFLAYLCEGRYRLTIYNSNNEINWRRFLCLPIQCGRRLFELIVPPWLWAVLTWWLSTGTKWCCGDTLSTRYVTVYIVTPFRPVGRHLIWNMSLAARKRHWTARNLQKLCARRDRLTRCPLLCWSTRSRPCARLPAPCPNSRVRTWKKGVFTLVPSDYRTRAPCSGTRFKRCLICFRMPSSFNGTRTGSARKETSSTVHGCRMFL